MAEDHDASDRPSIGRFTRRHGAGVIASLVASFLFLYLLNPLLAFFGRSLLYVAALLNQAYLNRIYAQAAHLETQDFSFWLISVVAGTFSLLPLFIGLRLLRRSLVSRAPRVVPDKSPGRQGSRQVRVGTAISFCFIGLLFLGWGGVVVTANFVQLSLISSFRQHVRIVAPYISDLEEKMTSEWSRMESKADYDRIYDKLRGIAMRAGIRLPENKLYSATSL